MPRLMRLAGPAHYFLINLPAQNTNLIRKPWKEARKQIRRPLPVAGPPMLSVKITIVRPHEPNFCRTELIHYPK